MDIADVKVNYRARGLACLALGRGHEFRRIP